MLKHWAGDTYTRLVWQISWQKMMIMPPCRQMVSNLGHHNKQPQSRPSMMPAYASRDMEAIIPADPKQPFDIREIIARIVDDSDFDEFKPRYGTTLVTGFAHIDGRLIGIIGNNGVLFRKLDKGGAFIGYVARKLLAFCRISPVLWWDQNMMSGIAWMG